MRENHEAVVTGSGILGTLCCDRKFIHKLVGGLIAMGIVAVVYLNVKPLVDEKSIATFAVSLVNLTYTSYSIIRRANQLLNPGFQAATQLQHGGVAQQILTDGVAINIPSQENQHSATNNLSLIPPQSALTIAENAHPASTTQTRSQPSSNIASAVASPILTHQIIQVVRT